MHYLDNAATSFPKPAEVALAVSDALATPGSPGRGSGETARAADRALEDARRAVAEVVGVASADRLAFTLNATDALNMAIDGLVRPGARIVTSVLEHSSMRRPLERRARERSATLTCLAPRGDGLLSPRDVAEAARGADLVALTHASNVTGAVQPLAEVASLLDARSVLLVDAAQAAGSAALDVDALGPRAVTCFTGHKGLPGPMGCGVIVAGSGVELPSWREGGTGDGGWEQPGDMPRRLEAGTPPLPAILGLAAAARWLQRQDPARVRRDEAALLETVLETLRAVGAEIPGAPGAAVARLPLVSFRLPGWSPLELAHVLESEHGVVVRAGLHCAPAVHRFLGTWPDGLVRASLGPTTSPEAVQALCDGLRDLAT